MTRKSRFTKMLISVVLIFNLLVTNVYADTNVDQSFIMNDTQICSGKTIPSNITTAAFSDEIDYDSLTDVQFQRAMSISGDDVIVNLSLFIGSSEVQLRYEGKMYKSFRYTNEKPVYIGVFENDSTVDDSNSVQVGDLTANFEIIYFEISNDTSPYNLNDDLRKTSSITMYLRGQDGTIYDLGSAIESPIVLEGVESQAPSDKDINWFLEFFQGTHDEQQSGSARSTSSSLWSGDLHSLRYQIADYEHSFLACPYIEFSYGDVPEAGVTPFSMSLKISESHRYRVVGTTSWTVNTEDYTRCFLIEDVQLTWTAGGNTQIMNVQPWINTAVQGDGEFKFIGLAAAVTTLMPQAATLSTILTVADAILSLDTGYSNSFTNKAQGGSLINTAAYKMKFPSNYFIERSGYGLDNTAAERFEYIAHMATTNSSLTKNYSTYAVADFTFTLSWADITGQSGSKVYTDYKELAYLNNFDD